MATADVQDVDTETGQIMLDEDYLPFQASQAVVRLTLFSGNTPLIANSVTISGINGYTFMQASTGMIGSAASFGEIAITPEEPTNEIWAGSGNAEFWTARLWGKTTGTAGAWRHQRRSDGR